MTNTIAETIYQQLGDQRFSQMTGAKVFVALENGVQFSFKGCATVNKCKITLQSDDLYKVEFFKFNRSDGTCPPVNEISNVLSSALQDVFSDNTGLDTHL
jgi:hypothetical protein